MVCRLPRVSASGHGGGPVQVWNRGAGRAHSASPTLNAIGDTHPTPVNRPRVVEKRSSGQSTSTITARGNARHRGHRGYRKFSHGGFVREHQGISPIPDRIRHIRRLSASGPGTGDHRLQHLRCRNHHLALLHRPFNDALLVDRNQFDTCLHAEITTRHHHGVGRVDDLVQVINRLSLLGSWQPAARGRRRPGSGSLLRRNLRLGAQTKGRCSPPPVSRLHCRSLRSFSVSEAMGSDTPAG